MSPRLMTALSAITLLLGACSSSNPTERELINEPTVAAEASDVTFLGNGLLAISGDTRHAYSLTSLEPRSCNSPPVESLAVLNVDEKIEGTTETVGAGLEQQGRAIQVRWGPGSEAAVLFACNDDDRSTIWMRHVLFDDNGLVMSIGPEVMLTRSARSPQVVLVEWANATDVIASVHNPPIGGPGVESFVELKRVAAREGTIESTELVSFEANARSDLIPQSRVEAPNEFTYRLTKDSNSSACGYPSLTSSVPQALVAEIDGVTTGPTGGARFTNVRDLQVSGDGYLLVDFRCTGNEFGVGRLSPDGTIAGFHTLDFRNNAAAEAGADAIFPHFHRARLSGDGFAVGAGWDENYDPVFIKIDLTIIE